MITGTPRYTRTLAVCAILDPYDGGADEPPVRGETIPLAGLSVTALRALDHVVVVDYGEFDTGEILMDLAARFPRMTITGYRVPPSRLDERIALRGCSIPWDDLTKDDIVDIACTIPETMEHNQATGMLDVVWE